MAKQPRRPLGTLGNSCTRIFIAVLRFHEAHGYGPSLREISTETGLPFGSITHHLAALQARGMVTWEPGQSRTLRPVVMRVPFGASSA